MSCCAYLMKDTIVVRIFYAEEIICSTVVQEAVELFMHISGQIANNGDMLVSELKFVDSNNMKDFLLIGNDKAYEFNTTIQHVFENQVFGRQNQLALVYEDKNFTFGQLNAYCNQLAQYLIETYTIEPDNVVALYLDRSEFLIFGIFAIIKSGAAYLPIDPYYPEERVKFILGDAKPKVILTNMHYTGKLKNLIKAINSETKIDVINNPLIWRKKATNTITKTKSFNLAYIIYTSVTTTGVPKGVMIEHRSVINLIFSLLDKIKSSDINKPFRCLFYANYVFDAHVLQLCISILLGNPLYVTNEEIRDDLGRLSNYIEENSIEFADLPPALLNNNQLLPLRLIFMGGDKPDKNILNFYTQNNININNCYGPTECTVCTSMNHYNNNSETNIGLPISNAKYYVLSHGFNLLPIGAIGELYIGGVVLARGYLNRPDLNHEKFLWNPFQTEEEKNDKRFGKHGRNARLYKTGDLVRKLPSGELEYIGRIDSQVKIRGYRIELGEIETASSSMSIFHNRQIIHPRNILEQKILTLFAEILGLDQSNVGIHDDFFLLGGNSILSVNLMTKLNNLFKSNLTVADIFSVKTVAEMSQKIIKRKSTFDHIVELSFNKINRCLFMVHPSGSGCEEYIGLANNLKEYFKCYGIDNYNLYCKNKFKDIRELAFNYLKEIKKFQPENEEYYILGWSFGGQIALEIAAILESENSYRINVILLDSFLTDNNMQAIQEKMDNNIRFDEMRKYMLSRNFDLKYMEKVITNIAFEKVMYTTIPNYILKNTKILLFKAMQIAKSENNDLENKFQSYCSSLPYNNVDKILKNTNKITVEHINCDHKGIIENDGVLASRIIKYFSN